MMLPKKAGIINQSTLAITSMSELSAFNSACSDSLGTMFVARNDGLFLVKPGHQRDFSRQSHFITQDVDFGTAKPKRIRSISAMVRASGPIELLLYKGALVDHVYGETVEPIGLDPEWLKIVVPRDIGASVSWSFGVRSIDGSSFIVSKMYADIIIRDEMINAKKI